MNIFIPPSGKSVTYQPLIGLPLKCLGNSCKLLLVARVLQGDKDTGRNIVFTYDVGLREKAHKCVYTGTAVCQFQARSRHLQSVVVPLSRHKEVVVLMSSGSQQQQVACLEFSVTCPTGLPDVHEGVLEKGGWLGGGVTGALGSRVFGGRSAANQVPIMSYDSFKASLSNRGAIYTGGGGKAPETSRIKLPGVVCTLQVVEAGNQVAAALCVMQSGALGMCLLDPETLTPYRVHREGRKEPTDYITVGKASQQAGCRLVPNPAGQCLVCYGPNMKFLLVIKMNQVLREKKLVRYERQPVDLAEEMGFMEISDLKFSLCGRFTYLWDRKTPEFVVIDLVEGGVAPASDCASFSFQRALNKRQWHAMAVLEDKLCFFTRDCTLHIVKASDIIPDQPHMPTTSASKSSNCGSNASMPEMAPSAVLPSCLKLKDGSGKPRAQCGPSVPAPDLDAVRPCTRPGDLCMGRGGHLTHTGGSDQMMMSCRSDLVKSKPLLKTRFVDLKPGAMWAEGYPVGEARPRPSESTFTAASGNSPIHESEDDEASRKACGAAVLGPPEGPCTDKPLMDYEQEGPDQSSGNLAAHFEGSVGGQDSSVGMCRVPDTDMLTLVIPDRGPAAMPSSGQTPLNLAPPAPSAPERNLKLGVVDHSLKDWGMARRAVTSAHGRNEPFGATDERQYLARMGLQDQPPMKLPDRQEDQQVLLQALGYCDDVGQLGFSEQEVPVIRATSEGWPWSSEDQGMGGWGVPSQQLANIQDVGPINTNDTVSKRRMPPVEGPGPLCPLFLGFPHHIVPQGCLPLDYPDAWLHRQYQGLTPGLLSAPASPGGHRNVKRFRITDVQTDSKPKTW